MYKDRLLRGGGGSLTLTICLGLRYSLPGGDMAVLCVDWATMDLCASALAQPGYAEVAVVTVSGDSGFGQRLSATALDSGTKGLHT